MLVVKFDAEKFSEPKWQGGKVTTLWLFIWVSRQDFGYYNLK